MQKLECIFVSGSMSIEILPPKVTVLLSSLIGRFRLIVGDAAGVDSSIIVSWSNQLPCTVYYSGAQPRLFTRECKIEKVMATGSGRDWHTCKDIALAECCDYGLVIWDGKSKGSYENIKRLVGLGKFVKVFYQPKGIFVDIRHEEDLKIFNINFK